MRRRVLILIFLTLLPLGVREAMAQTGEQKSRSDRLKREIAILDRQLRDNASKNADATTKLSLVRSKMKAREDLLKESERDLAQIEAKIASKQSEIDRMQARLDTMTLHYSALVKSAFKNRDARIWYMYILASENISQGVRRYSFFKNLSKQMNAQAKEIKESKAELEKERASLETLRDKAKSIRDARASEMKKLKEEEADAKKITDRLRKEKSKYQKNLAAKKRQQAALEQEIRRAIGNATGKGKKGSKSSESKPRAPVDYTLAGEFVKNRGKLPWPADGAVVAYFGKQYHPVFKSLQLPSNNGISIALPPDEEIKCVFDGVVAQITVLPGYHQCILVQHGNYFTLYSKVKTAYVKSGDKVKTGQPLGTVDTIGGETVFHFEIWDEYTEPQNPEVWLRPR